ncbi:MAG TPA: DNA methylase [Leptospiraceae bacterium]|nr:DNA methylase [Spirochaetaceae bacterium]HBS03609.1 DNA methylase [Leptospiraceae bacterium]
MLSDNTYKASDVPLTIGELWTSRQRQMHPIHYTVSYRASFKPELPDYFIKRYLSDKKKALVLDPFGGRGTTIIQSNLNGFSAIHNDLSPIASFLGRARRRIPDLAELELRLDEIQLSSKKSNVSDEDFLRLEPFFHEKTIHEIHNLRQMHLDNPDDSALSYIALTALSRLHGHSDGFFSVYSFPQISIMPDAQRKNNRKRGLTPEYKAVKERILKKMKRDLAQPLHPSFNRAAANNRYLSCDATDLNGIETSSVDLIVTSPPFLDKVDYKKDNWMRAWFLGVEDRMDELPLAIFARLEQWKDFMREAIREFGRVLRPGGHAVIEVGEVISGNQLILLEREMAEMLPLEVRGGGRVVAREICINQQEFTKLANCWKVTNNSRGTNTNRCLVIQKEG